MWPQRAHQWVAEELLPQKNRVLSEYLAEVVFEVKQVGSHQLRVFEIRLEVVR